jgi:hypothetical protein
MMGFMHTLPTNSSSKRVDTGAKAAVYSRKQSGHCLVICYCESCVNENSLGMGTLGGTGTYWGQMSDDR